MCGILGLATVRGRSLSASGEAIERMRDVMSRRGPDGAGLWVHEHVALAHRRLAVVDPSPGGAQPMVTADGRYAIVYNGELYNDQELRRELSAVQFGTKSDTETVLHALATWGPAGLGRLRGMYALGFYDVESRRLLLARDPLGIKPLYYTLAAVAGGEELVFASEPGAILAHPHIAARPDLVTVSAYLTTIRTVMGSRTLFDGVRTLRPGQAIAFDLAGERIDVRPLAARQEPSAPGEGEASQRVRAAVSDSVRRHLRSDVPICCLLSGGLDSSIIASVAHGDLGQLHTYCSGARLEDGSARDDFHFARQVADSLGTRHTEAPVSRELFGERWPEMVSQIGLPLSTPNEVAINEVARTLREQGHIVALSGEGADELFAGYEGPMMDAARYEGLVDGGTMTRAAGIEPGHFQLHANAWIPVQTKGAVLRERTWRMIEEDHALLEFYRLEFDTLGRAGHEGPDRLQPHLRFHRRINLAGLLQRLDTATMLEGVEGRTPFADAGVCAIAEGLGMADKFSIGPPTRTKRALREAFGAELPRDVVERAKASFPLPFEEWVGDHATALGASGFAREVFSEAAIAMVMAEPRRLWRLAWPMINIALWGTRWWG